MRCMYSVSYPRPLYCIGRLPAKSCAALSHRDVRCHYQTNLYCFFSFSLQTLLNVKPIGYSVYPHVMFTMEDGNKEKFFDIQTNKETGNSGSLRLLKPIFGPQVYTLRLRMDNKNSYGTVISVHNAFIVIYVSGLNFQSSRYFHSIQTRVREVINFRTTAFCTY